MVDETEKDAGTNVEDKDSVDKSISDLDNKIIKQVEYYFGDINLVRDKFMQEQIKVDDGWIPLETMLKFNRLANLTKESEVIVSALKKSQTGLMEVSEDGTKIRRSPSVPLPEINENSRQELTNRTVYCKGFPLDSKLDELIEYFNQYTGVINVVMRNYNDKATKTWKFKGSVFVNFKTVEDGAEFLKLESVKYNDTELLKMWMKDYAESKRKERLEERQKRSQNKSAKNNEDAPEEEEQNHGFPKGTVIQLSGFKVDEPIKRELVKEAIEGLGISVAYIEYEMGDETAWVRLENKDTAKELMKKVEEECNSHLVVNEDNKLSIRVVDGDEEEQFLCKAKMDQKARRRTARNKGKMQKRGRGDRHFHNKKRKGSPHHPCEPPTKVCA